MRGIRGAEIAMVFQDPMTSLNPAFTVGNQLIEAVLLHEDVTQRPTRARAPSSCSTSSASPTPRRASTSTRTSSPAACASG